MPKKLRESYSLKEQFFCVPAKSMFSQKTFNFALETDLHFILYGKKVIATFKLRKKTYRSGFSLSRKIGFVSTAFQAL